MSTKAAKTERMEFRVPPEQAQLVRTAAALAHRSTSQFIRDAVQAEASRVVNDLAVTIVEPDFFDQLWADLDTPEPSERLARQAQSPRKITQI